MRFFWDEREDHDGRKRGGPIPLVIVEAVLVVLGAGLGVAGRPGALGRTYVVVEAAGLIPRDDSGGCFSQISGVADRLISRR